MELEPHILALIGAATAAAGVGLVVYSASAASTERSSGTSESLLAPTLAVDTMDPDLRVAYMRTLVLDARLQARNGEAPTALGRELRRCLVSLQARRFAQQTTDLTAPLIELIDEACDAAEDGVADPPLREEWIARARQIRASLLPKTDR